MVNFKTIALSCAAAAAVAVSAPAVAGVKTKAVNYGDLDLSTAKGQARLQTRIKGAIKQVCGNPRALSLPEKTDLARCEANAMASAMQNIERTIARYKESKRLASNQAAPVVGN